MHTEGGEWEEEEEEALTKGELLRCSGWNMLQTNQVG